MTRKFFMQTAKIGGLATNATGVEGLVTGPMKPVTREVALATGLLIAIFAWCLHPLNR